MSNRPQMTDLARLITEALVLAGAPHPCAVLGHRWRHVGGKNCGCEGIDAAGEHWAGSCSVPVHKCDLNLEAAWRASRAQH